MNHLFVGLGGTGGKVLAALRRQIYQQYRQVDPAGLAIDYLYIDTSANDTRLANITESIEAGDRVWRTLGHSVQLAPGQIVHLRQGDFGGILANLDDYKTIKPWIGDRQIWQDIWNSAPNGIEAGGQLRRFGRLLFAQNAKEIITALQNRLASRQSQNGIADSRWTIHVVAGLAGGTGSGTFLDLAGQLRKLAAGQEAKIILYVVLPETQDTSWAKQNYYANGYAALAELNAALVKRLELSDVASESGYYDAQLPFDNCFIVTNRNENGLLVDVDKVLPDVIAETLFQIVVASGDAQTLGTTNGAAGVDQRGWRDMVTGENYFGGFERDAATGPAARANRFLTFGIKRIAIPAQEVREYSSMVFLRQYLRRALNNNWVEGVGFDEARRPFDAAAYVRNDDKRVSWCLTNGHLMLERPVLDNDRKDLRTIADDFSNAYNAKTQGIIKDGGNSDGWAPELDTFARSFFENENGFRRLGAPEFYRVAERSVAERAKYIVNRRISDDLFREWMAGQQSIRDVVLICENLIVDVTERMANCDKRVADMARLDDEKETGRKKLFGEYINSNKLNPLVNRRKMLQQLSTHLTELYSARASRIALEFMKKTLAAILGELQELKGNAELIAQRYDSAHETVESRRSRRVQDEAANTNSHQYKFYAPAQVRETLRRLEQTETLQRAQTGDLAARLKGLLTGNVSFAGFAERINEGVLLEELEGEAEAKAEEALAAMESERDRILEASIIQKLYEQFSGRREDLRRFIAERIREAGSFAAFAPNQTIAHGTGDVTRRIVAFVPATDDQKESLRAFRADLVAVIKEGGPSIDVIDTRDRGHEIVFLSLVNQFPLRMLAAVDFLKKKYDALVTGPTAVRKRLELHLQGDGSALPSLYAIGIEELRRGLRPHWLLAEAAGIIKETINATNGKPEVRLVMTNADGEINATKVGDNLAAETSTLSPEGAVMLRAAVEAHVAQLVHIDAKQAIKKALIDRKNAALEAAGYDEANPVVASLSEVVATARQMLGA